MSTEILRSLTDYLLKAIFLRMEASERKKATARANLAKANAAIKAKTAANGRAPMAAKTVKALELIDKGIEPRQALIIATNNPDPHPNTVYDIRKKHLKWSIERPGAQKIAHAALLRFAAGKDVNGIEPKAVDVRASAERIIDQVTPIIRRSENINVNVDCDPVDLTLFRRRE